MCTFQLFIVLTYSMSFVHWEQILLTKQSDKTQSLCKWLTSFSAYVYLDVYAFNKLSTGRFYMCQSPRLCTCSWIQQASKAGGLLYSDTHPLLWVSILWQNNFKSVRSLKKKLSKLAVLPLLEDKIRLFLQLLMICGQFGIQVQYDSRLKWFEITVLVMCFVMEQLVTCIKYIFIVLPWSHICFAYNVLL